jgi:hypothetical protein
MGHVAITDGNGGTVEAAGTGLGVRRGSSGGRLWHFCAMIPEIAYEATGLPRAPTPIPFLLQLKRSNTKGSLVKDVQRALKQRGFNPGIIDGQYGPHTTAAVAAFQTVNRLVADGVVGPATAKKLGIDWPEGA